MTVISTDNFVSTGAHLEGFFCLDETLQPNAPPRHIMAHIHRIQRSFVCVSDTTERSPVSKTPSLLAYVKIRHIVQPAILNILQTEQADDTKNTKRSAAKACNIFFTQK